MKKEETLLYDVVHDYIIAENFASDTEGANKVMLKLSDELMQEIYERTMTASEKRKDTMLKKKYDESDKPYRERSKAARMKDPHRGINSPAFKKFMADRGM